MNERIKLPDQEWLGYDPELGNIHGYTFEQMREFAELIVQECARKTKEIVRSISTQGDAEYSEEEIKQHFGIEE